MTRLAGISGDFVFERALLGPALGVEISITGSDIFSLLDVGESSFIGYKVQERSEIIFYKTTNLASQLGCRSVSSHCI